MQEREEIFEQRISNLENRISEMAEDFRKKRWLRIKITFCVVSVIVFALAFELDKINDIQGFLLWLVISPVLSILIMFIAYLILAYIIDGVKKDIFAIGEMSGMLSEIKYFKLGGK